VPINKKVWSVYFRFTKNEEREFLVLATAKEIDRIFDTLMNAHRDGEIQQYGVAEPHQIAMDFQTFLEVMEKEGLRIAQSAPKDWHPRGRRG